MIKLYCIAKAFPYPLQRAYTKLIWLYACQRVNKTNFLLMDMPAWHVYMSLMSFYARKHVIKGALLLIYTPRVLAM